MELAPLIQGQISGTYKEQSDRVWGCIKVRTGAEGKCPLIEGGDNKEYILIQNEMICGGQL